MENLVLVHHGIKGQRWGVRRRNLSAKSNYRRNKRTVKPYDEIMSSMSSKDLRMLGYSNGEKYNPVGSDKRSQYSALANTPKIFIAKHRRTPVAFAEASLYTGADLNKHINIAIGVRGDGDYRGKGYASKAAKKAVKWCEKHADTQVKDMHWWALENNPGSWKIAENLGFAETSNNGNKGWKHYVKTTNSRKKT